MMVIITGTPGCGKTTVSHLLKSRIDCVLVSVNSLLEDYDINLGTDSFRGYTIVDTEKMIPILDDIKQNNPDKIIIFEGHLAQDYPNADKIIVLRCNPLVLQKRLGRRDYSKAKIDENVSAEILGVCLQESYDTYGDIVQEIETSNCDVEDVVDSIVDIICHDIKYPLGNIDYLADYFHLL